jgi:hypothetical protein
MCLNEIYVSEQISPLRGSYPILRSDLIGVLTTNAPTLRAQTKYRVSDILDVVIGVVGNCKSGGCGDI